MSKDKVLVRFYAGDRVDDFDMLRLLDITLKEWKDMSQWEQDKAIDQEHARWMWNNGYVGWERL